MTHTTLGVSPWCWISSRKPLDTVSQAMCRFFDLRALVGYEWQHRAIEAGGAVTMYTTRLPFGFQLVGRHMVGNAKQSATQFGLNAGVAF